ncbi:MAG: rod shape-determining protein RodA [Saprospiraceae bacterium]
MELKQRKAGIDWITLIVFFSLLIVGWLVLYAATYVEGSESFIEFSSPIGKQTIWIFISVLAFLIVQLLDEKTWNSLAYIIYAGSIILLLMVLVLGTEIKGARSWFVFSEFSFQPSEIAKFGTCLALASYLSFYKINIKSMKYMMGAVGIILGPAILILLQPDAGSAIVFASLFIVLYRSGVSSVYYVIAGFLFFIFIGSLIYSFETITLLSLLAGSAVLIFNKYKPFRAGLLLLVLASVSITVYLNGFLNYGLLIAAVVFIGFSIWYLIDRKYSFLAVVTAPVALAIVLSFASSYTFNNILQPHQQDRINVWLRPTKCDPYGSLYNIIQSKVAIGSGGIQGKGFLKGEMTKLNYVPEQSTDFIFSTVGEEQGFLGSFMVIFLFTVLLIRITMIAERGKNKFIRYYAYSVASIIFVHFFINIGMAMGLMPVIGIPLPFLSKGGSSLLGFSIMIGVLLKMDQARLRR